MESWDDDNFEPVEATAPVKVGPNKWEGEDEDDDVKESWEDDEEDKEKSDISDEKAASQKPKKKMSLHEKVAEKERLKREELEKKLRETEEEEVSPEERLRRQKESDLKIALETTFGDNIDLGIDTMCPQTEEEFDEFAKTLMKKIQPMAKSTEYPNFAENLIRSICATLTSFDLKKIKTTIDNIYLEKQKIEKGDKTKKNKGKGKVKLKLEDSNQYSAYAVDTYDEFDDFM